MSSAPSSTEGLDSCLWITRAGIHRQDPIVILGDSHDYVCDSHQLIQLATLTSAGQALGGIFMPTALKVTPEQLQALSGTVARTSSDVRGAHQNLRGQLGPLLARIVWYGGSAVQHSLRSVRPACEGTIGCSRRHRPAPGSRGISLCGRRGADSVVFPLTRATAAGRVRRSWSQTVGAASFGGPGEVESRPATTRSDSPTNWNPRVRMPS